MNVNRGSFFFLFKYHLNIYIVLGWKLSQVVFFNVI